MLEKNSPSSPTQYSFEQLLGWFGRFTPQFKFRLQSLRRQMDLNSFDLFVRETLGVFRSLIVDLARVNKGPERARRVNALIDAEFRASPPTGISCAAGCGACCKSFPKQITDDEADLLALLVNTGSVAINTTELERQVQTIEAEGFAATGLPCLFLDADSRCQIYADRPSVCRKYHVTSPASQCAASDGGVVPRIDLMPELIVSAAMSMPDNGIGMMPLQIAKRLKRGV